MKMMRIIIVSFALVLFYYTSSFAVVDVAGWGGLMFNGKFEGNSDAKPKGGQYGVKAHYNFSLIPIIEFGIGGYYQFSKIKYDLLNNSNDMDRQSAGIDANAILKIPLIPLNPYVRGTYAYWDKLGLDTKQYKAYSTGAGLEFDIPIIPVSIFAEYMYDYSDHDKYFKMNSVNFGLKVDL